MKELDLQDQYLMNFLCKSADGLQYTEAKANTVSDKFFIVEDLRYLLSETELNKANYTKLLRKFSSEKELLKSFTNFLDKRISSYMNMAIFIKNNQSVNFEGVELYLFYPSGSKTYGDKLFDQNIFSVVQELPYVFRYKDDTLFSFRPDLTFFINGMYLGYSELKSRYSNQNAFHHGRDKVAKDYFTAVQAYLKIAQENDLNQSTRKRFLKVFEKAIHITATDIGETFIMRNLAHHFDEIKNTVYKGSYDFEHYKHSVCKAFKAYPRTSQHVTQQACFEEIFRALYDKRMIEKEILYYNFIERELVKKEGNSTKSYRHNSGRLIAPRPKQKFGADKIISKIDEFLAHEKEPNYFLHKLEKDLTARGLGAAQVKELVNKRSKYQNNKNVYSLLLQYAAGFGKSNIIGWTALQLKDLKKDGHFVYDKIMLVVDRLQLRDQLDSKMHNMNIEKSMFIEASDKKSFIKSLTSSERIVVVNIQKFRTINDILNPHIAEKLARLRIAFLIDEIHRSQSGQQHAEMLTVFDELQESFDKSSAYQAQATKKNLIIGFTATPSDHTLARFGEFNTYAEAEKIWVPFDSYTMQEAIADGYILSPMNSIVAVASKMRFETPKSIHTSTHEYDKYAIKKKHIYENEERIDTISKHIAEILVTSVYTKIRGAAKAMLATFSIVAAQKYKVSIEKYFKNLTKEKRYEKFKDAPIYVVYSESQGELRASNFNDGLSEKAVLQNFKLAKNALMIVVDKLQTGFNEPRLHTLFLDKEVQGINAIQTISRVNRTAKDKYDCRIIDFSYKNVNSQNIKSAFEHFSHVVVSDFDPLGHELRLGVLYKELKADRLYADYFASFTEYENKAGDSSVVKRMQEGFEAFIKEKPKEAERLKEKVDNYFKILNLIEFVISLAPLYSDKIFVAFWRKYSTIYRHTCSTNQAIDDIEIYFDNKFGIVAPVEKKEKSNRSKKDDLAALDKGSKYRYSILSIIAKRNEEEDAVERLIKDVENQIQDFFAYIKSSDEEKCKMLVAEIIDDGSYTSQEEIYNDFEDIYIKYVYANRKKLTDWFKSQLKGVLNKLCDDFAKTLTTSV